EGEIGAGKTQTHIGGGIDTNAIVRVSTARANCSRRSHCASRSGLFDPDEFPLIEINFPAGRRPRLAPRETLRPQPDAVEATCSIRRWFGAQTPRDGSPWRKAIPCAGKCRPAVSRFVRNPDSSPPSHRQRGKEKRTPAPRAASPPR